MAYAYWIMGALLVPLSLIHGTDGVQAQTETVIYSCDDGGELVVLYLNTDSESSAIVLSETSGNRRLSVAESGSGVRYSDGAYSLHTKGDFAFVEHAGRERRCNEKTSEALAPIAPEGMIWRSGSGQGQGGYIGYGVPETDDVLVIGQCRNGGGIVLSFAAAVEEQPGSALTIRFSGAGGNHVIDGVSRTPLSDEDFTGIDIRPGPADPLWSILKGPGAVTYQVGNSQAVRLEPNGAGGAIDGFLTTCAGGGGQRAPVVIGGSNTAGPGGASCDSLGTLRSQNSNTPVTMRFINRTEGTRGVMWLDYSGTPTDYGMLNPGQWLDITTFVGHPWMFTDGPGNCLEMFVAEPGRDTFEITAPNRSFGSE